MKILIYEDNLGGHRLEYLHHAHTAASKDTSNTYIFALPSEFKEKSKLLNFEEANNISFIYFDDAKYSAFKSVCRMRNIAKENKVDKVKLISFMNYMPFLAILMPKNIKVDGIIYQIYLYRQNAAKAKQAKDRFIYTILKRAKAINKLFILNDEYSAETLNDIYRTNKFEFISDPVNIIDEDSSENVFDTDELKNVNSKIFFHFGGLAKRKGTLEILKAIESLSDKDLSDKTFIFAGKVYPEIKEEFYSKHADLKNRKIDIRVFDKFCDYDFLNQIGKKSTFILAPYENTGQSSGCLSYSAYWKSPIIIPNTGLLAKLVSKFKLGIGIDTHKAEDIAKIIKESPNFEIDEDSSNAYLARNSISEFQKTFLS